MRIDTQTGAVTVERQGKSILVRIDHDGAEAKNLRVFLAPSQAMIAAAALKEHAADARKSK